MPIWETSSQPRVQWVDYAKGIGIILVVYSHVVRGINNTAGLSLPQAFYYYSDTLIYSFHMPLFFFLSGLFVNGSLTKKARLFIVDKCRVVAYPYLLWSCLQAGLQIIFSRYANHHVTLLDLPRILYDPLLHFWFLYALFFIFMLYALLHAAVSRTGMALLAALLYLCASFTAVGSLNTVMQFFIYFVAGALAAPRLLSAAKAAALSAAPAAILVTAVFICIQAALLFFHVSRGPILSFCLALGGIVVVVQWSRCLCAHGQALFVCRLGRLSLEIYVAHALAFASVRTVMQRVLGIDNPLAHIIMGTAAGIIVPVLMAQLCRRFGLKYAFALKPRH